jgi:hypothetical protein
MHNPNDMLNSAPFSRPVHMHPVKAKADYVPGPFILTLFQQNNIIKTKNCIIKDKLSGLNLYLIISLRPG